MKKSSFIPATLSPVEIILERQPLKDELRFQLPFQLLDQSQKIVVDTRAYDSRLSLWLGEPFGDYSHTDRPAYYALTRLGGLAGLGQITIGRIDEISSFITTIGGPEIDIRLGVIDIATSNRQTLRRPEVKFQITTTLDPSSHISR